MRLRGTQMHIISPAACSRCDLTSSSSSGGGGGACAVERSAVVKSSPPPKNRLSLRFSQPSLLTRAGKEAEEEEEEDYSLEAKAFETVRSEKGGKRTYVELGRNGKWKWHNPNSRTPHLCARGEEEKNDLRPHNNDTPPPPFYPPPFHFHWEFPACGLEGEGGAMQLGRKS